MAMHAYGYWEAARFVIVCFGIGAAYGLIRGIVLELRKP
jgi:hypothetical protein